MRSTWKGSISFGLVNIPIAVYPATREEKVSFKQLRKSDLSPIRYRKVAEVDEKEVKSDEIVKGYEYEKGTVGHADRRRFRQGGDRVHAHHRDHRFRRTRGD
jgi:Ku protein